MSSIELPVQDQSYLSDSLARQRMMTVSLWLLVVVTFTQPGRHGLTSADHVDWLALAKLGARGCAGLLLAYFVLYRVSHTSRDRAVRAFLPLLLFAAFGILS